MTRIDKLSWAVITVAALYYGAHVLVAWWLR